MPPKNAQKGGAAQSKKTDQKKKEKIIEDKTFGLKNKKGAKQQKFIQQVQHQVKHGGTKTARELEKEKEGLGKKKDDLKKNLAEINAIFKPVQQTAGKGSDPKSILCAFFKQGQCGKGSKCKFSHDLNVERKAEKRSAYVDMRDGDETSADWDEQTLMEVVEKKHGKEKSQPTTDIVCRYFLDAVENGKYGWFWNCPNGTTCIYRHALPPGFILKKDRKKMEKQKEDVSLEDLVERERAALGTNTTRVTLETFLAWKKRKLKEKQDKLKKDSEKKKKDYSAGKDFGLSGREMFTFNPGLASGEDGLEEGDESLDVRNLGQDPEDEENQIEYKEIDFGNLMSDYQEVDSKNVTIANTDRLQQLQEDLDTESAKAATAAAAAAAAAEEDGEEGATGGGDEDGAAAVDIDEALFDGDDEDLDELEDELEDLTVT
ncbi:zinc finger CCCH domain-containing protein 15 homolog [Eriocheir sinensis]|uniref:zinc finger CCCH domain-containing protein 15 homolog n=1 Tax=Eriocheir sinensis TaxID=95602 RepID=UPI0021C5B7DA|nr:zinc finger CCCH domain-containing protein 15 homolog [Eriocheir sinensis]